MIAAERKKKDCILKLREKQDGSRDRKEVRGAAAGGWPTRGCCEDSTILGKGGNA
jgi:hypothetical protein